MLRKTIYNNLRIGTKFIGGLSIAEKDMDKEGLCGFYHHLIQGFKIIIPEVYVYKKPHLENKHCGINLI